jgi:hypothetical protein
VTAPLCKNCDRRKAQPGRRGLCWTCSLDETIRDRYPISPQAPRPMTPAGRRKRDREIVRRWSAGETLEAIAAGLGLTREGVRRVTAKARAAGAERRAGHGTGRPAE